MSFLTGTITADFFQPVMPDMHGTDVGDRLYNLDAWFPFPALGRLSRMTTKFSADHTQKPRILCLDTWDLSFLR